MKRDKEYIFITDGYRGGANTLRVITWILVNKKQSVVLYDVDPNKTFEKLNKKIEVYKVDLKLINEILLKD